MGTRIDTMNERPLTDFANASFASWVSVMTLLAYQHDESFRKDVDDVLKSDMSIKQQQFMLSLKFVYVGQQLVDEWKCDEEEETDED